jgi:hypothetical protein
VAQYTHRVAISNHRILNIDKRGVDGISVQQGDQTDNRQYVVDLSAVLFFNPAVVRKSVPWLPIATRQAAVRRVVTTSAGADDGQHYRARSDSYAALLSHGVGSAV